MARAYVFGWDIQYHVAVAPYLAEMGSFLPSIYYLDSIAVNRCQPEGEGG